MPQSFTPFLTFQGGVAEAAMNFYCTVFPDSRIVRITRYAAGMPGPEGTVMTAEFTLGEQRFLAADSPIRHQWDFTPGISIFVDCKSAEELDAAFAALAEDGRVYMPIDNYGFSQRFGWVGDKFGVTWQLNLA
jgi:predicted 3-demethylubiquinone-9 3-methyltransferase (glyoxalase superfamily)